MKQINIFETGNMQIKSITLLFILIFFVSITKATAQDSLKIIPLNPEQGVLSIYQLSFVTTDTLYPKGQISISFPEEFDLSQLKIANSTNINGGFKVVVQGQQVILNRTGLGRSIMPKQKVQVKFANVKNPFEANKAFPLKFEFQFKSTQLIRRTEEVNLVLKPKNN